MTLVRKTKMEFLVLEQCFPVQDANIPAMIEKAKNAGVSYQVIAEIAGVEPSTIRQVGKPRSERSGKNWQHGYRICNALQQISRVIDKANEDERMKIIVLGEAAI